MSHTDLGQPDLAALRAAAGDAEFAEAEARLVSCLRVSARRRRPAGTRPGPVAHRGRS